MGTVSNIPLANSALDQMLQALAEGDPESSLRIATLTAKEDLQHASAFLVMGLSLVALKQPALAIGALELAASLAAKQSLPLAIAAGAALKAAGKDPAAHYDRLAKWYSLGSPALRAPGAVPPPGLPKAKASAVGLQGLRGEELLRAAEQAVEYAQAALELDTREPLDLSPQQLFSALSLKALRRMLDVFTVRVLGDGETVIEQGSSGEEAFILARGELEVRRAKPGQEALTLARLGKGALVGEMALLARAPRAASVAACRPSIVLSATKQSLDEVAQAEPQVAIEFGQYCHRRMIGNLLTTSPLLKAVHAAEHPQLIERLRLRVFEAGAKLISQGQPAQGIHLIASGQVRVIHRDETDGQELELTRLGPGDSVGEVAVILRRAANADVVAAYPTISLFIDAASVKNLITEEPRLLAQLYALAVARDEETTRVVEEDARSVDDVLLL